MSTSSNDKLALMGGAKLIHKQFKKYNSIGQEEKNAAIKVIESGTLSKFLGVDNEDFYGGPKVIEFEKSCSKYFGTKHAITVNSWTSGLVAAVGAIGISPGDEVITTPWTMAATAASILHWNGIPVFCDIDRHTFNIDPKKIENCITPKTKAILAVDIFGMSSDMEEINNIAKKYNLKVISDTAQAPGSKYKDKFSGTIGDIGGYSLNYHKHINTGEGGILVTNDDKLAERMRLIRNHAEVVIKDRNISDLSNLIGHNFRLGEIECAIGIEQLKKLDDIVILKKQLANFLTNEIINLDGLHIPYIPNDRDHVYYVYPIILDTKKLGVSREKIVSAIKSEGLDIAVGYQNLHLLPTFQKKIAFGNNNYPWKIDNEMSKISYERGICPVAEELHESTFISIGMCAYELNIEDMKLIAEVFLKVWNNMDALKD